MEKDAVSSHHFPMDTTQTSQTIPPTEDDAPTTTRFERPREGRIVAGVALALAERTGISVGLVRAGFVIATLFAGFGILAYAVAWLLVPSASEASSPIESWAEDVRDPDRRVGAVLIGTALAIVLVPIAPVVVAAAALVGGAGWLLSQRSTSPARAEAPAKTAEGAGTSVTEDD
jgi:phage shock protein PspC (stress-responsive transcriptional regulator)